VTKNCWNEELNNLKGSSLSINRKVLVLGDSNRSFLSVIRSLGRKGIFVHIAWCPPNFPALSSRYIAKIHHIPFYSPDEDSWKKAFIELCKKEVFDIVIPCDDEHTIPLQHHRTELESFAHIYLLSPENFEIVSNKAKTYKLTASLGISVPKQISVSSLEAIDEILSTFTFPIVLKPLYSFTIQNLENPNEVRKAHNEHQLYVYLESMLREDQVLVQEHFIGTGVGVEILAYHGNILFAFQHIPIHEEIGGGVSSYRKSSPIRTDLLEATSKLMKHMNYTGIAMAEFRVNFDTGKWVFLEINGRFWGSLALPIAAGADFPFYLYQLLVEGKTDFSQEMYQNEIYCRNLLLDAKWMIENLEANRSDPTLCSLPFSVVAKEIKNVLLGREHIDTITLDDPKPGFLELVEVLVRLKRNIVYQLSFIYFSLSPVRRMFARRARNVLMNAKMILFVCTGNICRSPFAEYYAKTNLPRFVQVLSRGHYHQNGRPSPSHAIEAAHEFGIDLRQHRACVVTEDIVRQADIIFVFDQENYQTIIASYPFVKSKTYFLGFFDDNGNLNIKDPYGGDIMAFKIIYQQIVHLVNKVISSYT
jgi:protein-tyrosine-phosphatase/predicted ATP-grasp superfamily ATP-dependent carboligase